MRILYVCADRGIPLGGSKGASVHVRSITAALAARGHQVTIACRRVDGGDTVGAGLTVEPMPADESGHESWLTDLLARTRPNSVVERYSLSSGPALSVCRRSAVSYVLEVNGPLVDEAERFRGLADAATWRRRERRLLAGADHVIAVSEAVASHVRRCEVAADRISVIPNGVDLDRFAAGNGEAVRRRYGLDRAAVVGFCGSLKPWHGVLDLVAATALLPTNARLLIVGDGPQRPAVVRAIHDLGLADRVVMTGAVSHHAVPQYLAAMDVAVAPYAAMPDFYFSPLKVVEYLAAGLPVVASSQGELDELSDAGVLIRPSSPVDLAAAICALLDDSARRHIMSAAARRLASERTWSRAAAQLESALGAVGVAG